jgi:hypothetical protein
MASQRARREPRGVHQRGQGKYRETARGIGKQSSARRTLYSCGQITDTRPIRIRGSAGLHSISGLRIERQNLTVRMQVRRFTSLMNAFWRELEKLRAALSLYFAWYNFCRVHSSLRVAPAMQAGITDHVWSIAEVMGFEVAMPKAA